MREVGGGAGAGLAPVEREPVLRGLVALRATSPPARPMRK